VPCQSLAGKERHQYVGFVSAQAALRFIQYSPLEPVEKDAVMGGCRKGGASDPLRVPLFLFLVTAATKGA